MGRKFSKWVSLSQEHPRSFAELAQLIRANRQFTGIDKLEYGDHGLMAAKEAILRAIRQGKRIALYADYDVDGTMSCVSWIWFLRAIGYDNFLHYIPCRFNEGYGVNLGAVRHLIDNEKAELIITMDTGITANEEAALCRERGVDFICTDHHKIQQEKMPDCIILNPKLHPEASYQELCGCGITFVLLRKLAADFALPPDVWTDILALVGMATICDVVPLNGVNHRLARFGVEALMRSRRPVLRQLREAGAIEASLDEKDVGFRLGPRINAVGRLRHADYVIKAFIEENPEDLIRYMEECNDERKVLQNRIVWEATAAAAQHDEDDVLFLGGDWHQGVVGIAASKIAERFWRPTWLFQKQDGLCKGSARSVPGFDVTEAMASARELFVKYGGHRAAGGFSFLPENEGAIRAALQAYAAQMRTQQPDIWESKVSFDCHLSGDLASLPLADALNDMKPFGHGFEEPLFCVEAEIQRVQFYFDKHSGEAKHTAVHVTMGGRAHKIMFFNDVAESLEGSARARFLVTASKNSFRGVTSLQLMGKDWEIMP